MKVDIPIAATHSLLYLCHITPMGKPRMTRRDRWGKRPVIKHWNAYKDYVRLATPKGFKMPYGNYWMVFRFQPPKRWAIQKKIDAKGTPHQQRPDKDNLEKGILDIFLPDDDSLVYDGRVTKIWGTHDSIEIWWDDGLGTG